MSTTAHMSKTQAHASMVKKAKTPQEDWVRLGDTGSYSTKKALSVSLLSTMWVDDKPRLCKTKLCPGDRRSRPTWAPAAAFHHPRPLRRRLQGRATVSWASYSGSIRGISGSWAAGPKHALEGKNLSKEVLKANARKSLGGEVHAKVGKACGGRSKAGLGGPSTVRI